MVWNSLGDGHPDRVSKLNVEGKGSGCPNMMNVASLPLPLPADPTIVSSDLSLFTLPAPMTAEL
jgi:hypothetical protein